jgi:hypothetical protein
MGNIVIYGLCGEKRRAKGNRTKRCSVERWAATLAHTIPADSSSRITARGIDVRKRPPYLPRALTLRGAQRLE